MYELREPIKISEAVSRVMQFTTTGIKETIDLSDADGRYIAEDITADHPVPPFDKSPLDGFAVRSEDTLHASADTPVKLEVIETVGAGHLSEKKVNPGQAVRVMTGTLIPDSCNTVVMFELAVEKQEQNREFIEIRRKFEPGDFVSKKGEEMSAGEVVVEKGTKITAGVVAVLATFGYSRVPVVRKPVIGIYATGTELLEVHEDMAPGKIRNSNAHMVISQIRQAGGEPVYYGKLNDDFDACFKAVSSVMEDVDALITTGGVSVGDFDFLPEIYEKLGADVLFNKIAMRPGSVTTVAHKNGKLLFGLSGNPSACFVGFELYARPWIRTFLYSKIPHLQVVKGVLMSDFPKPNPFTRFIRSKVDFNGGKITANPVGMDKSQVVTSLAGSDALVALPGGTRGYKSGDEVDILLLHHEGSSKPVKDPVKLREEK